MANLLIPWQRYLSDVAHKYVGYPDEEGGEDNMFVVEISQDGSGNLVSDKTSEEIYNAAQDGEIPIAFLKTEDEVFTYTFTHGEYIVALTETYSVYFINIALIIEDNSSSASVDEMKITGTSCEENNITISATSEG